MAPSPDPRFYCVRLAQTENEQMESLSSPSKRLTKVVTRYWQPLGRGSFNHKILISQVPWKYQADAASCQRDAVLPLTALLGRSMQKLPGAPPNLGSTRDRPGVQ